MMAYTGVDGVTVARGAIGNPWVFRQARALAEGRSAEPPTILEQREVMAEHFRLAEEIYGPDRAGQMMRKFAIKYAQLHPRTIEVRDAFIGISRTQEWFTALETWYSEDGPGRHPAVEEPNPIVMQGRPGPAAELVSSAG